MVMVLGFASRRASTEPSEWFVAREFLWGDRFPEPLMMVDHTDAGDKTAAEGPEVLHYVRDALGSVVGLVDAGDPDATPDAIPAKLVERYDYDPYGKTYVEYWDATGGTGGEGAWIRTADAASHFGNPFMWTSQRYDQTVGLYHFPFRSYSPELGRWMQRDPLGYVDGVNMYEYVGSMPTAFGDPTGLTSVAPGTTPGWDPMSPDGWHPPMLPPDEGEYGPDGMGPPAPPLPGPCGDGSGTGGSGAGPDGDGGDTDPFPESPVSIEELKAFLRLHSPDDLATLLNLAAKRDYEAFLAWLRGLIERLWSKRAGAANAPETFTKWLAMYFSNAEAMTPWGQAGLDYWEWDWQIDFDEAYLHRADLAQLTELHLYGHGKNGTYTLDDGTACDGQLIARLCRIAGENATLTLYMCNFDEAAVREIVKWCPKITTVVGYTGKLHAHPWSFVTIGRGGTWVTIEVNRDP